MKRIYIVVNAVIYIVVNAVIYIVVNAKTVQG
jgi:hypothetical protein